MSHLPAYVDFAAEADTGMGLRAASHVSMENTVDAHEYQPTCQCADCSAVLNNFTQYDLLDAYVARHLPYEAQVEATFGYIPCVGSPRGNVLVRVVTDAETGEQREEYEASNALFFHFHCHQMRPVPAEVRVRSLNRFFEARGMVATTTPAAPAAPQHNTHFRHQHHAVAAPYGGVGRYGGAAAAAPPRRFASGPHNKTAAAYYYPAPMAAALPDAGAPKRFATHAPAAGYYTQRDIDFAARSVAFTGAAHLGCG